MRRPLLVTVVSTAAVLLGAVVALATFDAPVAAAGAREEAAAVAEAPPTLSPVDDWTHVWEVVRLVQYRRAQPEPPVEVFVYYLGDSLARESLVGDDSWTDQLSRRGAAAGKAAASGFTLGGHDQTFGMDEDVVAALPAVPAGQPAGIVLIGVGISRFIGPPAPLDPPSLHPAPPGAEPPLSPWVRHRYDTRRPLTPVRKRQLVTRWMERRWAGFKANRTANVRALGRLVKACKAKGLRPVLVDLPLDLRIASRGLQKPRTAINLDCRRLSRRHGVRYLRFNRSLALRSSFFWDLHHLVRPGYRRWQTRLTAEVVKLLPPAPSLAGQSRIPTDQTSP